MDLIRADWGELNWINETYCVRLASFLISEARLFEGVPLRQQHGEARRGEVQVEVPRYPFDGGIPYSTSLILWKL